MDGEIFFDMTREEHPIHGVSKFLMKRWTKYTIYSKSGSFNRTENPLDNFYQTNSVYLYDYVIVSDQWYYQEVYTASVDDTTPAGGVNDLVAPNLWHHRAGTFRNSPNAITNNYLYTYDPVLSVVYARPVYNPPVIFTDDGVYFEIVKGYPRNHFTHKRDLFALYKIQTFGISNKVVTSGSYYRNRQTIDTTIGENGLEDGTSPVQSVQVSNVNLVQTDNVISH